MIRENGCGTVVCKLGASGCCVVSEEGEFLVPGYSVTVRDLTGAGDGFAAGLLHGLAQNWTLVEAAQILRTGMLPRTLQKSVLGQGWSVRKMWQLILQGKEKACERSGAVLYGLI